MSALFDVAILARYEADDLVIRLVEMFSEDAPRLAREVAHACDADTRARAAHTLCGCALNLGAAELARVARTIEQATRSGDDTRQLAASLEALAASTVNALRAYCSGMQRAPVVLAEMR